MRNIRKHGKITKDIVLDNAHLYSAMQITNNNQPQLDKHTIFAGNNCIYPSELDNIKQHIAKTQNIGNG